VEEPIEDGYVATAIRRLESACNYLREGDLREAYAQITKAQVEMNYEEYARLQARKLVQQE